MSSGEKFNIVTATDAVTDDLVLYKDSNDNSMIALKEKPYICYPLKRADQASKIIRTVARSKNIKLNNTRVIEIIDEIDSRCYESGTLIEVNNKIAKHEDGYISHLSDSLFIKVNKGTTTILHSCPDEVYFYRRQGFKDTAIKEHRKETILSLLKRFNCSADEKLLLLAWLIYTISTPKSSQRPYPILKIYASAGSGKSILCGKIIRWLIDANDNEMSSLQANIKDIAISAQSSHGLIYDNLRSFNSDISDTLCKVSTGGSISSRMLYSDNAEFTIQMRAALVLNGIHAFGTESDLISRCVTINLRPLNDAERLSEADLSMQLEHDLPEYLSLLHALAARILAVKDTISVTYKSRMADFSVYVAALEFILKLPQDSLQNAYKRNVEQSHLAGVVDDSLFNSLCKFAKNFTKDQPWCDNPHALLDNLISSSTNNSDMPKNAAAMSKKLLVLQEALANKGVHVIRGRATDRFIKIWCETPENAVVRDEVTETLQENSSEASAVMSLL